MTTHVVCSVEELPPGSRKIIRVGRTTVGVFNVDGQYYAVRNVCPHHGADLCMGDVGGTMLPSDVGEFVFDSTKAVVRCPRHRWEFDLCTGRSIIEPERYRVKSYPTDVRGSVVVVEL
jgi:3-phenylpropionate/trans-cinnamate dioxygenase ferredoxin subunit